MTVDIKFDQTHIWHPYTSMTHPLPSYPVVSAEGCELILEDGTRLVDGMASWWCAIHGYNVAQLNTAIQQQTQRMSHVMFGGITHEPAIALAKQLVQLTPDALQRVFLADSGSVSVEVALKMALQYWQGRSLEHSRYREKSRFLALTHAYHGDTFGAMSVCDPKNGMHRLFAGFLADNLFLTTPPMGFDVPIDDSLILQWRQTIEAHHHELAALIVEPVVQGAGGMRIYNPQYLQVMRSLCDEFELLLIFDEIATGFGRSGKLFAAEHGDVCPDIMCLGKALTGGYMTLSATLATQAVAETICASEAGVFMHGPTFMGNPLACAVAVASIELLQTSGWSNNVERIEAQLQRELAPIQNISSVADVRVKGAIGVVELNSPVNLADVQKQFVEAGVWIRPFGKLVYIMPPFNIASRQLTQLTQAMAALADRLA